MAYPSRHTHVAPKTRGVSSAIDGGARRGHGLVRRRGGRGAHRGRAAAEREHSLPAAGGPAPGPRGAAGMASHLELIRRMSEGRNLKKC